MTIVLWAALGMTAGAAVFHAVLGLQRPRDRTHLGFAAMMASLAMYFYFGGDLYRATTAHAAVEALRRQVLAVLACHACMLVFVPAYTNVRIPRLVMRAYWGALTTLFVANLWAPCGLWFSTPPDLVYSNFLGEPYTAVVAPPMSLARFAYYLFFTSFLVIALECAIRMRRRGERQRSLTFAAAVILLLVINLVDLVRDIVGGSWPYVAEFGFVTWALILSVQLAYDFRVHSEELGKALAQVEAQAVQLRSILAALCSFEDNMHVPLERLETGVAALTATTADEDAQLGRLRRAVTRLRELARSMADCSTCSLPASLRG